MKSEKLRKSVEESIRMGNAVNFLAIVGIMGIFIFLCVAWIEGTGAAVAVITIGICALGANSWEWNKLKKEIRSEKENL